MQTTTHACNPKYADGLKIGFCDCGQAWSKENGTLRAIAGFQATQARIQARVSARKQAAHPGKPSPPSPPRTNLTPQKFLASLGPSRRRRRAVYAYEWPAGVVAFKETPNLLHAAEYFVYKEAGLVTKSYMVSVWDRVGSVKGMNFAVLTQWGSGQVGWTRIDAGATQGLNCRQGLKQAVFFKNLSDAYAYAITQADTRIRHGYVLHARATSAVHISTHTPF